MNILWLDSYNTIGYTYISIPGNPTCPGDPVGPAAPFEITYSIKTITLKIFAECNLQEVLVHPDVRQDHLNHPNLSSPVRRVLLSDKKDHCLS